MRRHPRVACVFVSFILLFAAHCSEDSGTNPGTEQNIRFPLAVGNAWQYTVHANETAISTADESTLVVWDIDVSMEIEAVEQVLGDMAYRLKITHAITSGPDSGAVHIGYTWIAETDSSLIGVASKHSTMFWPGTAQLMKPAVILDEIEPNEWGSTILIYPLNTGTIWHATQDFDGYISKQVLGYEKLTVNNQDINTCMVSIHWDFSQVQNIPETNTITMNQWFAPIGLVKQTNRLVTTVPEGTFDYYPVGSVVTTDYTMTLVDYHIVE